MPGGAGIGTIGPHLKYKSCMAKLGVDMREPLCVYKITNMSPSCIQGSGVRLLEGQGDLQGDGLTVSA